MKRSNGSRCYLEFLRRQTSAFYSSQNFLNLSLFSEMEKNIPVEHRTSEYIYFLIYP